MHKFRWIIYNLTFPLNIPAFKSIKFRFVELLFLLKLHLLDSKVNYVNCLLVAYLISIKPMNMCKVKADNRHEVTSKLITYMFVVLVLVVIK